MWSATALRSTITTVMRASCTHADGWSLVRVEAWMTSKVRAAADVDEAGENELPDP